VSLAWHGLGQAEPADVVMKEDKESAGLQLVHLLRLFAHALAEAVELD
jgi:hypothetical protein